MKTRKWIAIALTVSVLLTLCAAALADNGISGSNNITVSYCVEQNYEIVIPPTSVPIDSATSLTVSAQNVRLPEGKALKVNLRSANGFKLICSDGKVTSTISYSVTLNGQPISNNAEILKVESGYTSGNVTLSATVNGASAATLAGKHSDTLSFISEVIELNAGEQIEESTGAESGNSDGDTSTIVQESTGSGSTETPTLGQAAGAAGDISGGAERPESAVEDRPVPEDPVPSNPYPWQK